MMLTVDVKIRPYDMSRLILTISPQNECFLWVYRNQPVCPSVCASVYQKLVILCGVQSLQGYDQRLSNSFITNDDTRNLCGQCRLRSDHRTCSLISDLRCPHLGGHTWLSGKVFD